MPYISTIDNQAYTVNAGEEGHHRTITIDGQSYDIDWQQLAPLAADAKGQVASGGRYSLLIGGKSYEVYARQLTKPDNPGNYYEIFLAGQRFEVHVEDEREKALTGSIKSARESGEASVRAPMPGLVLGIPLEVGAQVERGHPPFQQRGQHDDRRAELRHHRPRRRRDGRGRQRRPRLLEARRRTRPCVRLALLARALEYAAAG